MPAHAGIQVRNRVSTERGLDSGVRRNDNETTYDISLDVGRVSNPPLDNAAAHDRNYFAIPSSFLALSTKL
jgi:hypothetical protein